jgi:hypothetical protein
MRPSYDQQKNFDDRVYELQAIIKQKQPRLSLDQVMTPESILQCLKQMSLDATGEPFDLEIGNELLDRINMLNKVLTFNNYIEVTVEGELLLQ